MDVAEWIIVAILSIALLAFLILGIVLVAKLIKLSGKLEEIVEEGQDVVKNANGVVSNVKGMTSIGGVVEMLVDKYITPRVKEKIKEPKTKTKESSTKERSENGGKKE